MKWYWTPLLVLAVALPALATQNKAPYDVTVCPGLNRDSQDCRHFHSRAKQRQWEAQLKAERRHEASALGNTIYRMAATILRIQARKSDSQPGAMTTTYYVSILGEDPPASFFQQLKGDGHNYKPGSLFNVHDNRGNHFGMRIDFYRFQPLHGGRAKVWWGTFCGFLCASGQTSTFKRVSSGHWVLLHTTRQWIS